MYQKRVGAWRNVSKRIKTSALILGQVEYQKCIKVFDTTSIRLIRVGNLVRAGRTKGGLRPPFLVILIKLIRADGLVRADNLIRAGGVPANGLVRADNLIRAGGLVRAGTTKGGLGPPFLVISIVYLAEAQVPGRWVELLEAR